MTSYYKLTDMFQKLILIHIYITQKIILILTDNFILIKFEIWDSLKYQHLHVTNMTNTVAAILDSHTSIKPMQGVSWYGVKNLD